MNVVQGKDLCDQRADFGALDAPDEIAKDLRLKDRAAEEAEVLEVERAHIQFNPATPVGPAVPSWASCFTCTPAMAEAPAGPVGPASENDMR